jgi:MFS family permease
MTPRRFTLSNPQTRGLVVLYSSTLMAGMWGMVLPAIPLLSEDFGISLGMAAQLVTAVAIGRFVGLPVSGVVLDRLGTRAALVSGPLIAAIAALLAAIVPWFGAILVLAAAMGVADSLWTFGREIAGIDLARQDQRGRVLSGFHGVHNIGLALGPLLGGLLAEAVGFRAAFLAYAACAAISVPLGFSGQASPPRSATRKPELAADSGGVPLLQRLNRLGALFKQIPPDLRATFVVLVLATFTSFIHRTTLQSILPLYANSRLGLSPSEIGLLFSIMGVFVFIMILPAGIIIDKIGRKWATVPSTGIPALVFIFIPLAESFFQLAVLVSLMGVANGLSLGSIATSTYDVVPASARGRLQAVRRTLAETGAVGAPLLGGFLADAYNPGVPFLIYSPLLVLSAVLLAVIGRETLKR